MTPDMLPADWRNVLADEFEKDYFEKLEAFINKERETKTIYPPESDVFNAFKYTPYKNVKVLLLGQDPYHGKGQAHGMAFSVKPGITPPPSLKNMLREMADDIGGKMPNNGCLIPWAEQGILLVNAVLTVEAGKANSHKNKGWEKFTDAVIEKVSEKPDPVVFVLWGGYARKKVKLIDESRHTIIESAHPSPLSAHSGFFGSRPYSKINEALKANGEEEIAWQIPDV
jgi:uracil-DNA glycosylase